MSQARLDAGPVEMKEEPRPNSVLGYKAYWGTSSHHYESNTDVGANTSYTISGLQHGSRYFFAVSAYNADGESGLSAEVSVVVERTLAHRTAAL